MSKAGIRVVNAWNGLAGKVVATETVDRFKFELDRNIALQIEE